jgi:phosphopentomutase
MWNVGIIPYPSISGTEVIKIAGKEHLRTKKPILYTSDDSVVQVACHTDVYSLEKLYEMCQQLRDILVGDYEVGRVIARPFATNENGDFYRLPYRKDFALDPPKKSNLEVMQEHNIKTLGIGKISSIFKGIGIDENLDAKNNDQSFNQLLVSEKMNFDGFVFANFVDTDMLYGHRNDVEGDRKCIEEFDRRLPEFLDNMADDDILIITGDHGNDPTTPSVSHSREYTPFLCYGKRVKANNNIGTIKGFNFITEFVLEYFGVKEKKVSDLILEK